ncbi:MAG: glyceraldehyde-3-phosphate dehydrogenase [Sulfurovum sp. PC08-66]|nr:MAG: glyceraldehyde-3-phosphate dehydrogenase [Sulfurovum sp. PC08-66]KIM12623.1 MAG: glyceraldehyde-3-phosphate dehydrogenase [Sulfuricurvum sp. PC08-66]
MALKVAINGFGRIGRALARIIAHRDDIELVAINDIATPAMMAYLLKHDSVHGTFDLEVALIDEQTMQIGTHKVKIFTHKEPKNLNFAALGVEVVYESSGQFLTQEAAQHHIDKGVKKVIFSAPAQDDATPTFVMGVNHLGYQGQNILSNASCTTNCLAPIAYILDKHYGIEKGLMTTIHAYTQDQSIVDSLRHSDPRRSRAAGVNLIPTTTRAAKAIDLVLPQLTGKLHGQSVRVPTPNVSIMDLNVVVAKNSSIEELQTLFKMYAKGHMQGILLCDESMRVSQDFVGSPYSSIVALDLIQVIQGNMIKVMAWYDNEWGYASRLVDMAHFITQHH